GEDGGDVVGYGVALRLPLLGHDVADIDLQGVGLPDRLHDAIHQQIGDDAGVQAAGPQDDHIRVGDGG
ncbi:DNA (cytosine-5-)-methyltransferase, partial [Dysosmobacter welbionis]